jgi:hypothetical protein
MQEDQNASKETQEPEQKDRVRDFLSREEITGISIGIWLFAFGFFLLRLYIYDHIPADPDRTTVLIDSMFSLVLAIVVILQSVIYAQQAKFMKQQAKSMEEQRIISDNLASIALRQFEITDRPWLKVDVSLRGPLTFSDQGGNLGPFHIVAKNVGRSVAVHATFNTKVVIPPLGGNVWAQVLAEQTRVCQNIHSEFMSYAVFPNDVYSLDNSFGLNQEELERGRLVGPGFRTDFVQIYLVGCVDYQFSGQDAHHQTRFIYEVIRTEAEHPGTFGIHIGQDVPLERLMLQKMIVGRGDYAD